MLQTVLFLVVAGIPIFLFLRRIRALSSARDMHWC